MKKLVLIALLLFLPACRDLELWRERTCVVRQLDALGRAHISVELYEAIVAFCKRTSV